MGTAHTIARLTRRRRRQRHRAGQTVPRVLRWTGVVLGVSALVLAVGALIAVGVFAAVYNYYAAQLPPPERIVAAEEEAFLTSVLYDRTGQTVLYEVIDPEGGDRRWVRLGDLPPYVLQATVAIEDASFYRNPGYDLRGMMRALWANLTGGQLQGGSTITQQLVRNVLLAPEERRELSVGRKVKEVILATEISRLYSKDQILEWYINTNFYGGWAYGIEAAAQQYFSKPARDLTLAEAAMLAAIPQFPLQNPIDNPEAAKLRQGLVLGAMVDEGYITQQQADEAFAQPLAVRPFSARFDIIAPHFSFYARAEAEAILNDLGLDGARLLTRGGLRIYTTLDLDLQLQAECVARSYVSRLDGGDPFVTYNTSLGTPCPAATYLPPLPQTMLGVPRDVTNAAVVVLRGETGEILSMVGSVDYWDEGIQGNYNAALAQRQPASSFKPFVYMAAFLQGPLPGYPNGITAATMTYDVPIEFDNGGQPYTPVNIDRQYHGPMSVRDALANSYNVPPVQLANLIGLGPILRTAHRLGINSLTQPHRYGLALALGSGEVSLLDLTYAYNVFNQGGYMVGAPVHEDQSAPGFRGLNPVAILRIEDADGQVLWQYGEETGTFQRRLVLEPALAYILTDILADDAAREPAFGRGSASRRRQDRHHQRQPRRLDGRLHAATGGGRVGGQQRQPLDERRHRCERRRPDLARADGVRAHPRRPAAPRVGASPDGGGSGRVPNFRLVAHAHLSADPRAFLRRSGAGHRHAPFAGGHVLEGVRGQRVQRALGERVFSAGVRGADGLFRLAAGSARLGTGNGAALPARRVRHGRRHFSVQRGGDHFAAVPGTCARAGGSARQRQR